MAKFTRAAEKIWFLWGFLVAPLVLCRSASASGVKQLPRQVPNQYGWLNITEADTANYCKAGGCAEHTKSVLWYIHQVKSDYRFISKASVQDLNQTITLGCQNGRLEITTSFEDYISSAGKIIQSRFHIFSSIIVALFLVAYFNM